MSDAITSHETTLDEIILCAAKDTELTGIVLHKAESLRDFAKAAAGIVEMLTGDTRLVELAGKLPEVGF